METAPFGGRQMSPADGLHVSIDPITVSIVFVCFWFRRRRESVSF